MVGNLGRSAVHLSVTKIIAMVISLVSGMLLSRFRSVSEYGTYSQMMMTITLVTALITLGLPNSTNYFLARANTHVQRKTFLSNYYTLSTMMSMLVGIVLVFGVPLIEDFFQNTALKSFTYFLALYPWTSITISSISNVLVVYGKTKHLMLVNLTTATVSLLSVLVVQVLDLSFADYVFIFLVGNLAISAWIYVIVSRLENGLSIQLQRNVVREIMAYSIPIGLAALVGTINIEVDKLMISRLMGTEELAYYTNAGRELPFTLVASSLTAVLLPQVARRLKNGDKKGAVSLWWSSIEISYAIICFFFMACVVFAPQIITLLYSEKYLPGVQVFRVYSLVLLLRTTYFGLMLNSLGKTRLILWSSIISLVVNALMNYMMYVLLGFVGPAVATFLSILLINILQLTFTTKELQVPFRAIFPWKVILRITGINVVWGGLAFGAVRLLGLGSDAKGIIIAIGIGLVVTVCYFFVVKSSVLQAWNKLNHEGQKELDEREPPSGASRG